MVMATRSWVIEIGLPLGHCLQPVQQSCIVTEVEDAKVKARTVEDIHA